MAAGGWEVYSWDDRTGLATFEWSDGLETHLEHPARPEHSGWDREAVLAVRPRAEMMHDQLFASVAQANSCYAREGAY